jgi:hypothetical protein
MNINTAALDRRTRLVCAAIAALVLAVGMMAAMLFQTGEPNAEASGVDPETRATFALFERPRSDRDEIPRAGSTEAVLASDAQPGEDRSQSRRVDLPGGAAYAWPMHGGVCATWGNCVRTELVREIGVALSTDMVLMRGELESIRLSGIVRNGIREVRFSMPEGEDVTVDVRDNLFSVELSAEPSGMSWRDDRGSRHEGPLPGNGTAIPPGVR